MSTLSGFQVQGNQVAFLAATVAPTAVQVISTGGGACQIVVTNNGVTLVHIITANSQAAASVAASAARVAATVGTLAACIPLFPSAQMTITAPPNSWITGITSATIAQVFAVPGEGL